MTTDALSTSLQFLKGVGPRRAADLERVGLRTVEDLLYRFPIRYEDRGHLQPIASLRPGQIVSVTGRVSSCGLRSTRRPGFKIFEALVTDQSGSIRATWLNQPFLRDVFASGRQVVLFGAVEMRGHGGLQLTNPQYEMLDDEEGETIHTGRIVPVYEKTGSVTAKIQRRLVHEVLQQLPVDLPEQLPEPVRARLDLPSRRAALFAVHFPPQDASIDALNRFETPAQRRLIFEEGFSFQIGRPRAPPRRDGRIEIDGRAGRRSGARIGASRPSVQADGRPAPDAQGDRRRLAASPSDESPAAGRRRRRQDDRGPARGAGRDGKRSSGGVHGADRDSRRAALREHLAPAGGVAVSCRVAHGLDERRGPESAARPRSHKG